MRLVIRIFMVCLLGQALPVSAAWYQVEVIVFSQLNPNTDGEIWYENPGLPERSESIELITDLADAEMEDSGSESDSIAESTATANKRELIPYLQLPSAELKLAGVQRVLKLSSEYRPLLHIAWQQPALRAASARPVHLQQFEEVEAIPDTDTEPEDIESLIKSADEQFNDYEVPELLFDGTIKLRSSKFLHADIDFAFFPVELDNTQDVRSPEEDLFVRQEADYVRLTESRKIRLNEIHYFDHPHFGVILRVSRLKIR